MSVQKEQIIEAIEAMTVMELVDLVSAIEDKFGVSAAAAAAPVAAAAAPDAAPEAEQTEFDVLLQSSGDKKVAVIKVVRAATGLGLKEAKDLVDSAPNTVKEALPKAEAEELLKQIEEAGGSAELK